MSKMALLLCLLSTMASGGGDTNIPQGDVILTSLANPVYPKLAKLARVAGDVELNLSVRPDGTVESADAISGPEMLKQPTLDSVHQSRFECRACSENATSYRMVYSFQLVPPEFGPGCQIKPDATYPQVIQSQNHVTVIDQSVVLCDPVATITKVRSAKCLFLWKCSKRYSD